MPDTFSFIPDTAIELNKSYSTIISEYESGAEQRRSKRDDPRNEWALGFRVRTISEKDSFISFFDSQKGALNAFYWTNPEDNVQRLVRFKEDSLQIDKLAYGLYSWDIVLVEVTA